MQCCPHTPARQIPRDLHEHACDVARALAETEAFEQSRRERKKVEMCFAHIEANLQARPTSTARLKRGQRRGAIDRNRAESAASRQVPLPTATISASHLCSVAGLPSARVDTVVRGSQRRTPQADQCSNPVQLQKTAGFCNTIRSKADVPPQACNRRSCRVARRNFTAARSQNRA